jgi:hypothetical protein
VRCDERVVSIEGVMPGYRSLSSHLSGAAAEHAREAEAQQRGGDAEAAARLLEEALETSVHVRPELPGWVCGRLASIYRTLKRYDDEVALLERYRDSQTSDEARNRFDARLSKARAIAERKRRSDTGALATVRQVRVRSSQRRRAASALAGRATAARSTEFAPAQLRQLCAAIGDVSAQGSERLRASMIRLCAAARVIDQPMASLVLALKTCWIETPKPPSLSDEEWHERYATALVELLALSFGESN